MNRWYFTGAVLLDCVLLLTGCPSPPGPTSGPDTTPPELLVIVRLESPSPPNPRGEFDITSLDVSKVGLASDLIIRVNAVAGDSESGITNIVITGFVTWQCAFGHNSPTIGTLQRSRLAFKGFPDTPPPIPATPLGFNIVTDPILMTTSGEGITGNATGCSTANPGWGPVNINGFLYVTAFNAVGLTTTSQTFSFDYTDVGSK
jgi:hypothetical protein